LKKGGKDTLEVLAFAPPPTMNLEAAMATSSFTTSVANNLDIVPRCSINNAVALLRLLDIVHAKLEEKGLSATGPKTAFELLRYLTDKDSEMIMSPEDIFKELSENQAEEDLNDMNHLYVPGKVILIYEKIGGISTTKEETGNATLISAAGIMTDGASAALRHFNINTRMMGDHMPVAYEETLTASWAS
jgi:hypothetical protein